MSEELSGVEWSRECSRDRCAFGCSINQLIVNKVIGLESGVDVHVGRTRRRWRTLKGLFISSRIFTICLTISANKLATSLISQVHYADGQIGLFKGDVVFFFFFFFIFKDQGGPNMS